MMKVLHSCYQITELIYGSVTAEHLKIQLFKMHEIDLCMYHKTRFLHFLKENGVVLIRTKVFITILGY